MSQLDDIKTRAQTNSILGKTASQDEAKDTLKLVAALEAVEAFTSKRATDLRNHADALNHGSPIEERFSAYADEASATAATVFDLIREALS